MLCSSCTVVMQCACFTMSILAIQCLLCDSSGTEQSHGELCGKRPPRADPVRRSPARDAQAQAPGDTWRRLRPVGRSCECAPAFAALDYLVGHWAHEEGR